MKGKAMKPMAECMMGRAVERHSPARLASAMREVHDDIPSTVPSHMKGKKKEAMLRAIAYSKAREKR